MSHLLESIQDGVATLTMNRPEARNAMNTEIIEGLQEALPRLGADNEVRCIVLTGANGAFCAGGDVKGFCVCGRWWNAADDRTACTNASARI